jgi:hypothetical protein
MAASLAALIGAVVVAASVASAGARARSTRSCPHWGRPALAQAPRPHALRVFAIQFEQQPAQMTSIASYAHAIDCAMRLEVVPLLARHRPNLVVFDEDVGLETLASGARGAPARALLRQGVPACKGQPSPCATVRVLLALNAAYAPAIRYLEQRFPSLGAQLDSAFIAGTDRFVRGFMATMAREALRYRVYIVASNTQAPFRLSRDPSAVAALRDPSTPSARAVYEPTADAAYDQTFLWGPRVLHPHAPGPLRNLLADNRKVPLTTFEIELGFVPGPARGAAARANLRPFAIPGTGVRLGFATSLPAFTYGTVAPRHACDDVSRTYMRCLDRLGANVVIQADANDGQWTGAGSPTEPWQPLTWMGSAWRAVSDPSVHFAYAVNPFIVGNLADTPFDGQSAILERGRHGNGCYYVGDHDFVVGQDDPALRRYAGPKPQFLALAPWVRGDAPRSVLLGVGAALAAGTGPYRYVRTAVVADLPIPVLRTRPGCVRSGR